MKRVIVVNSTKDGEFFYRRDKTLQSRANRILVPMVLIRKSFCNIN